MVNNIYYIIKNKKKIVSCNIIFDGITLLKTLFTQRKKWIQNDNNDNKSFIDALVETWFKISTWQNIFFYNNFQKLLQFDN